MTSLELRQRLGLSRADWARALNVNERTIRRWEDQGMAPGGVAEEIIHGIASAIDEGVDATRIGALVNLGGIRSLVCYALVKRVKHVAMTNGAPAPGTRKRRGA